MSVFCFCFSGLYFCIFILNTIPGGLKPNSNSMIFFFPPMVLLQVYGMYHIWHVVCLACHDGLYFGGKQPSLSTTTQMRLDRRTQTPSHIRSLCISYNLKKQASSDPKLHLSPIGFQVRVLSCDSVILPVPVQQSLLYAHQQYHTQQQVFYRPRGRGGV